MASRPRAIRVDPVVTLRGGEYNRLTDPGWTDPLDTTHSQIKGGRWNPPGSFAVLYLNDRTETARLQVLHKLMGMPYGPQDLDASEQHGLAVVQLPEHRYLDCVSDDGLASVGLPSRYPRYRNGRLVRHAVCQRIGEHAWAAGLPGVACRSAATGAARRNEELAFFDRPGQPRPQLIKRVPFDEWWWHGA